MPVLKRQLLLIGTSIVAGLTLSYFFGFFVGLVANIAILLGIIFYIRRKHLNALKSLGFSDETAGRGYMSNGTKLKYVCISCGKEVKGMRCDSCGSNMEKPIF